MRHNESGQGSWQIPGSLWHSPSWQPGSAHHREVPFLFEPHVSHPSSRVNSKCIWNGLSTWGRLEMSWGQDRADVYPLHGTMKGELGRLIWPWTTGTLGRERVKKQWRWHRRARQAMKECLQARQEMLCLFCKQDVWGCGECGQWLDGRSVGSRIYRQEGAGASPQPWPKPRPPHFPFLAVPLSLPTVQHKGLRTSYCRLCHTFFAQIPTPAPPSWWSGQ